MNKAKEWVIEYMIYFKPLNIKIRTVTYSKVYDREKNRLDTFTDVALYWSKRSKNNRWFKYVVRTLTPKP